MTVQLDEFKTRVRATWDAGDYATMSERIAEVGELVAAKAGIEWGMDVLDVACGTGNAAVPAARAGLIGVFCTSLCRRVPMYGAAVSPTL